MTAAWFTNVAKTSELVFQAESWGFDAKKITLDEKAVITFSPGSSGVIPLSVDNSGEDVEMLQIGVTMLKSVLGTDGTLDMDTELQKRIFFYADTAKTYTFEEKTENNGTETDETMPETVSKVYLGFAAPNNYTYSILPGQKLTMSELYCSDVPLKWECVLDMVGYYCYGTIAKSTTEGTADTVVVDEYLRPIEYDYIYDNPVFGTDSTDKGTYQQLQSVQDMSVSEFLEQVSSTDGYKGTIDSKDAVTVEVEVQSGETKTTKTQIYYPVEVDENGYGVWAYLCTKDEIQAGIAYDTELAKQAQEGKPVTAKATIVLTANNVSANIGTATDEATLREALSNSKVDIVELGANVSPASALSFTDGSKIIDLNGYTLSYSGTESAYSLITVENGAELTVINGDVVGKTEADKPAATQTKAFDTKGGSLVLSGVDVTGFDTAVFVEDMNASVDGDSNVQIINCTFDAEQSALVLQGNGEKTTATTKVIVQGSKISSEHYVGICGQGNSDRWGTELVLVNSEVTGYYGGIYQPQQKSITTISECTISGNTGIALKGGTINIYNSKVVGTGAVVVNDVQEAGASSSGFTDTGDAVYVEAVYGWSAALTLQGDNNEIVSEKAYAVELFGEDGKGPGKVLIYDKGSYGAVRWNGIGAFEIFGGNFTGEVSSNITRYDLPTTTEE